LTSPPPAAAPAASGTAHARDGWTGGSSRPAGLPTAADILGRAAGENFPVAHALLGASLQADLTAVYGWARLVDELGDRYAGDRLAALDWVEAELDRALAGEAGTHELVAAAAELTTRTGADPQLLRDLVTANRRDQTVTDYATWDELVGYCRCSADPVGRIVLAAFGAATPQREAWSDRVCTALQLIEHTQDVAEDHAAGRTYLPAEDRERFDVVPADLAGPGPARPEVRALVAFEAARARRLLAEGEPLVASMHGRARLTVAGFVAGGHAALDALTTAGFDPLAGAPAVSKRRLARRATALLIDAAGLGERS
jgi:squalene synthase HpnC